MLSRVFLSAFFMLASISAAGAQQPPPEDVPREVQVNEQELTPAELRAKRLADREARLAARRSLVQARGLDADEDREERQESYRRNSAGLTAAEAAFLRGQPYWMTFGSRVYDYGYYDYGYGGYHGYDPYFHKPIYVVPPIVRVPVPYYINDGFSLSFSSRR